MTDRPLHLNDDSVLDLVHGLLDDEETRAALHHVEECASCAELVRERATEVERTRASARPHRGVGGEFELGRPHDGSTKTIPLPKRRRSGLLRAAGWAAAASVAFLVWTQLPRDVGHVPSGEVAEATYWIPVDSMSKLRSSADSGLARAFEAYVARDASSAVAEFRAARVNDDVEGFRNLYLASALLHAGEAEEAVATLDDLNLAYLPPPWRARGLYTLALALSVLGDDIREADALELLSRESGPEGDAARESLDGR